MNKTCQNCQNTFTITEVDQQFYKQINVHYPTFCPNCRLQRRLAFRNERTLYKRTCDLCKQSIVSVYHKDSPYTVYCQRCWWSDNWDPMDYGQEYDFNRAFFEQFRELQLKVPRITLANRNPINSPYVSSTTNSKNCYLIFASGATSKANENCLYGYRLEGCINCVDNNFLVGSIDCYEIVHGKKCNKVFWGHYIEESYNSVFLENCKNVSNCYGCVNLRNANNKILNKQYSSEEYVTKISNLDLGSFTKSTEFQKKFNYLKLNFPYRYSVIIKSDNCIGNDIYNSKNAKHCFFVYNTENSKYIIDSPGGVKDSYDVVVGAIGELLYEGIVVSSSNIKFCSYVLDSRDCYYSEGFCSNSADLFGCIGLRQKQYCILNKQYSEEEYKNLIEKIKEHMNQQPYVDSRGLIYKYGEFFPVELSPYYYNETSAQEYFPLTEKEIKNKGYKYTDIKQYKGEYEITLKNKDIPDHIENVNDSIMDKIIECSNYKSQITNIKQPQSLNVKKSKQSETEFPTVNICKGVGAYRIIPQELAFYRKQILPIPRLCPDCRHYERIKQRNLLKLWKRRCTCRGSVSDNGVYKNTAEHFHGSNHCPNEFETTYAPERQEIVYCERCYLVEVA